jgi:hypothetical protein
MTEESQQGLVGSGCRRDVLPRADDSTRSKHYKVNHLTWRLLVATVIWSGCELPIELWLSGDVWERVACLLGRGIWCVVVWGVLVSGSAWRVTFVSLCGISVVTISFGLLEELRMFPIGFFFSAVECVLKGASLIAFISGYGSRSDEKA